MRIKPGGGLVEEQDARGHAEAGDLSVPGIGTQQSGKDTDSGALARSVGPQQATDSALRHGQVETVERPRRSVALAKALADDGGVGQHSTQLSTMYGDSKTIHCRKL